MKFLEGHHFHQTVIIATTNYPDKIESALLRPGRLDYLVEFGLIEDREIKDVLNRFFDDLDDSQWINDFKFKPITISSLIHNFIIPNMYDKSECIKALQNIGNLSNSIVE